MSLSYLDHLRCLNLFYENLNHLEVHDVRPLKKEIPVEFLASFLQTSDKELKYSLFKSNWFLLKRIKTHRKCGNKLPDDFKDHSGLFDLDFFNRLRSLSGNNPQAPVFYCHFCNELYLESELTVRIDELILVNYNSQSVKFWFAIFKLMDLILLEQYWFLYLIILVYFLLIFF